MVVVAALLMLLAIQCCVITGEPCCCRVHDQLFCHCCPLCLTTLLSCCPQFAFALNLQGVVYGVRTEETMADRALINRYDYDGIFGTGERGLQEAPVCCVGGGGHPKGQPAAAASPAVALHPPLATDPPPPPRALPALPCLGPCPALQP